MIETGTGVKLTMVPYRGTGGLLPDMLGGRLNISQDLPAAYVPHLKSGKVRVIAVLSDKRIPSLPDVPTSAESGFPQLQIGAWYGLFGPKGLPKEIVAKLNRAANEALQDPAAKAKVEELGYEAIGGTPEHLADDIKSDMVKLGEVVRLGKVKME
jgi:tripartite-type tricarboxylate transporter receptor subunit TctC